VSEDCRPAPRIRTDVHVVAAAHTRHQGHLHLHARIGQAFELADLAPPPEEVSSPVTPRRTAVPADGGINAAPGIDQLVGDLAAGSTRADDEHRARGQLAGIAVVAGMDLLNACGEVRSECRNPGTLVGAGREHDVARFVSRIVHFHHEPSVALRRRRAAILRNYT
jgi:hypothetical protein